MSIECTKLPVLSSVGQAFRCLWHYRIQHVLIALVAALPFTVAGITGHLDPVFSVSPDLDNVPAGFNLSFALLVMTTFLWAFPVTILWHRLYLLGPEHLIRRRIWPLLTRSLNVISRALVFFGMALVTAIALTAGILYLRVISDAAALGGSVTEMGQVEQVVYVTAISLIVGALITISLRLSMAFAAQSIGKSLGFITSWRMTRRNTFRMLAAGLISVAPLLVLDGVLLWAAKTHGGIDVIGGTAPEPYLLYLFVFAAAPVLTLPLAMLCSLTASIYRHCGCADYRTRRT